MEVMKKINYFASLGYLSDPSYLENSKFERYSGRANVNAQVFDWFKMGVQVSYSKTSTQSMALTWGRADAGSNQGNVMRFVNGHAPIVPVHAYNEDGSLRVNSITGTTNYFLETISTRPALRPSGIYRSSGKPLISTKTVPITTIAIAFYLRYALCFSRSNACIQSALR